MYVLPVTWLDFNAKEISDGNLISWQTATEKNNNKYKVWRSFKLTRTFEQIGEILSKGNGLIPTNYSFLDTLKTRGFSARYVFYLCASKRCFKSYQVD